jgi:hypothetical protein
MSTSLETALWLIAGGTVVIVAVGVFGIWWERRDRRRHAAAYRARLTDVDRAVQAAAATRARRDNARGLQAARDATDRAVSNIDRRAGR